MTKSKKFPVNESPVSGGKLTRTQSKAAVQAVVKRIQKKMLDEAHEKYNHGEPLSDEELDIVYRYYQSIQEVLSVLHQPKYVLFAQDVNNNIQVIELMKMLRRE